jgi:hypothetical protein
MQKFRKAAKAVADHTLVGKYVDFCHEMANAQYLTPQQRFEALHLLEQRWSDVKPEGQHDGGDDHGEHDDHGSDLPPELRAFESPAEQLETEFNPKLIILEKALLRSGTWSELERVELMGLADDFSTKLTQRMSQEIDTFDKILSLTNIGDFGTERFLKIYSATMDKIKSDDRDSFDALNAFVTSLEADWKGKSCKQQYAELLPFYIQASQSKPSLEALLKRLQSQFQASSQKELTSVVCITGPLKHVFRIMEKVAKNLAEPMSVQRVFDAVRGMITCDSMASILEVMKRFKALNDDGEIRILRIKNRYLKPSAGGWSDLLMNFRYLVCSYCAPTVLLLHSYRTPTALLPHSHRTHTALSIQPAREGTCL